MFSAHHIFATLFVIVVQVSAHEIPVVEDTNHIYIPDHFAISNEVHLRPNIFHDVSSGSRLNPKTVTDGCGMRKGCFLGPEGCSGMSCDYGVSYFSHDNYTDFEVFGKVDAELDDKFYVSIGFNTHRGMSGASVIDCISYEGTVTIQQSHNVDHSSSNPLPDAKEGLNESASMGSYADGYLTCRYSRLNSVHNSSLIYDLAPPNEYYLLLAIGPAINETHKEHHLHRYQSPQKINFTANFTDSGLYVSPCIRAHACLMVIAWAFLAGFGIINSRYYKTQWSDKQICGLLIWFAIHRTVMLSAVTATAAAFVTIFVSLGGWPDLSDVSGSVMQAHPYIGVSVMALAVINPIMAFFRPGKGAPRRVIFNWCHRIVGQLGYLLAVFNIFLGLLLPHASGMTPDWLIWVMVGHVSYHLLTEAVLLAIHRMSPAYGDTDNQELLHQDLGNTSNLEFKETTPDLGLQFTCHGLDTNAKLRVARSYILLFYTIVTLGTTLTVVITLATYTM